MPDRHHKFSPSKLQQYALCPASFLMQDGLPDVGNAESEEGTMLHDIIASGSMDADINLTDEQKSILADCFGFIRSYFGGRDNCKFEQYLEVFDKEDRVITGGTADLVCYKADKKELWIVDWKFGRVKVPEAKDNIQIATYALAAMQKYETDNCIAVIYQPRCTAVSFYKFTNPAAILRNITTIIKRAKSKNKMTFAPSELACRYCKAKYGCPSYTMYSNQIVKASVSQITTAKDIAEAYEKAKVLEDVINQIKQRMSDYIDENGSCEGYIKVRLPGSRECNDIQGIATELSGTLTPEEFTSCCTLSIPKVESLVVDKWKAQSDADGIKTTKLELKKRFNSDYDRYISRKKDTTKIMKEG